MYTERTYLPYAEAGVAETDTLIGTRLGALALPMLCVRSTGTPSGKHEGAKVPTKKEKAKALERRNEGEEIKDIESDREEGKL